MKIILAALFMSVSAFSQSQNLIVTARVLPYVKGHLDSRCERDGTDARIQLIYTARSNTSANVFFRINGPVEGEQYFLKGNYLDFGSEHLLGALIHSPTNQVLSVDLEIANAPEEICSRASFGINVE